MFIRILLAVDGSEHATKAVDVAVHLAAKEPNATVRVLHAMTLVVPDGGLGWQYVQEGIEAQTVHAEELVSKTRAQLEAAGIKTDGKVAQGSPAKAVVEEAKEIGADLIIVGSRGLSKWQGLLLGSTSHQVMQMSHCPVLVVR